MSATSDTPLPDVGEGIRPLSLGLTWTLTALATVAVGTRFFLRKKFSNVWSSDDWIMLFALGIQLTYQGIFTKLCAWGNGLPADALTPRERMEISKWGVISSFPSISVSFVARISISILLVRIFGVRRWFKLYFVGFTALLTFMGVLSIIFQAAQARPYEGLWDASVPAIRWDPRIYQYTALGTQFLNAISDLTYVLFPVLIIWKLNMPTRRKVALVILMTMSLVTFGVVLVKIVMIFLRLEKQASYQLQRYFQSLVHLVAACEQCLVIILGCVPTLRVITKLKVPNVDTLTSWMASLVPRSRHSRSTGRSGHGSSGSLSCHNSEYENLELARRVKVPGEDLRNAPSSITHRTEFTVEYSK